jgi:hypothetical protein
VLADLSTESRNRDAARKGFDEKKRVYALSHVLSTREIAKHARWRRTTIERHQTWLASCAVDIWRHP